MEAAILAWAGFAALAQAAVIWEVGSSVAQNPR